MNVSVLSDEKVVKEIRENLKEYMEINDIDKVSPATLWDGGKAVIRGKIIEVTSRLRKDRLKQQRALESKIRDLEVEHKRKPSKSILQELKENKHRLDKLLTFKAEGALCFTNQRYYEMGIEQVIF